MTQDNYFGRKAARTGAAQVLEQFADKAKSSENPGGKPGASTRREA
jgi:hypothetical protein